MKSDILTPQDFFEKEVKWKQECAALRSIVRALPLCEELKWGKPCYTYQKRNILLIHSFKEYCALLFFKGVLLKDPNHLLFQQTENVQAARQLRFTSVKQIYNESEAIEQYVSEAIEIEKSRVSVTLKRREEYRVVEEFQQELERNAPLQEAFDKLTPGRQKGYLLYFANAKQEKTRLERVKRSIPKILSGRPLHE